MNTVRRAIKTSCIFAAVWCLGGLHSSRAQAQVLDQIPSDALVVWKVNHLQDTNTKVSNLLQSLGMTDLFPTMKDPLATLETQLGIGPGLDSKRDAAAVVLNGTFEKGSPPPFILLLPVSDYKQFVGSTTVVRTEGDVSVVHFKENEDDIFVENWGGYAVLSDKKDNVTAKHEGLKVSVATAKQLDSQDACIYVNFPVLKGLLQPQLKEKMGEATDQITKQITDPAKLKLAQSAISQGVNIINEFLNDAQGATIGLSISPEGISQNMIVELTPDSYLGKLASSIKNTDGPLLAGLPKENYLFYGGTIQNPAVFKQVIDDVLAPILKDLTAMGDDGKKLVDSIQSTCDSMSTVEGATVGIVAPTAALGQGSLFRMLATYKGDAEKLKAAQSKTTEIQNQAMKVFGMGTADLMKTTVTPDFKTVNGVKLDRVQQEVNPDNTSQEAMRASEMLSQLYGPDGASVLVGAADPKTLVVSLGNDDDLISQLIDAAKANKDVLSDQVKAVDDKLPKSRATVAYFGLGQLFATGLSYAKANGMNMPVQIPNNLPPIGMAAGTDGPSMQGEVFIPIKLLQSTTQAVLQIYMQFNGHGNGGGGGL